MKTHHVIALLAGLAVTTVALGADPQATDAAAINRWFNDILLIISNLKGLIEPIVGLAIAVVIAQNYITLRRQKVASVERAEQTVHIANVSAKVDGLTTQAVTDAGTIGRAEGAALAAVPVVAQSVANAALSNPGAIVPDSPKE